MTAAPFLRLALVAGSVLVVAAVAVVWQQLGWPAGVCAIVAAPVLAAAVTVERTPDPPAEDDTRPLQRRGRPKFEDVR